MATPVASLVLVVLGHRSRYYRGVRPRVVAVPAHKIQFASPSAVVEVLDSCVLLLAGGCCSILSARPGHGHCIVLRFLLETLARAEEDLESIT